MSDRPLETLFFLTSLGGGGAESHTLRLLNCFDRARIRPSLAVCKRGGSYEKKLAADVPIHEVSIGQLPSSTARVAAAAVGLTRLVRRTRPDVVVSVMDNCNVVALGALGAFRYRPKLVASVQIAPNSYWGSTPTGRYGMFPAMRHLYPRADRVIALSHGVGREIVAIAPGVASKLEVIHNACTDADDVRAPSSDVPETARPVVIAVGRLTEQKAYPDLLDAFAALRKDRDAELWILGEGPDRAALDAQIARLGVGDDVKFLGFRDDVPALMRRATIFVLSSIYEGFGNVVVEALGVGTPVVSTDCPHGPGEILKHDETGLLVPVRDPAALAAAMRRLLDDPALRVRLSEAGLERAEDFKSERIADQYTDMIERVAAGR